MWLQLCVGFYRRIRVYKKEPKSVGMQRSDWVFENQSIIVSVKFIIYSVKFIILSVLFTNKFVKFTNFAYIRCMKPGLSYDLVKELAVVLNATKKPAMINGVAYQIMVFHTADTDLWVVALIPLEVGYHPSVLFNKIMEQYGAYLNEGTSVDGVLFFESKDQHTLLNTVDHWYDNVQRGGAQSSIQSPDNRHI